MIEFKISEHPDQQFATILEGRRVTMRLRYNVTTERWSFDLSIDDLPVLHGRRIVTGVDLLKPFGFDIGIIFAAPILDWIDVETFDSSFRQTVPDRVNLPNGNVKIFHTTQAEIDALTT